MKQLMRRFSRIADCSSAASTAATPPYQVLRSEAPPEPPKPERRRRTGVPSGHVPVYVGDEMRRFAVHADLLNHPVFAKLLNRSAQVYGYDQKGVLHIPCHVAEFERVLHALRRPAGRGVSADVDDDLFA